jgi:hypothetical protein
VSTDGHVVAAGPVEVGARIVAAGAVGGVAATAVLPAAVAAVFGAWAVALPAAGLVAAVTVLALALVHRHTGGRGRAVRWAALVTAGATLVSVTSAAAWQLADQDFGRWPLLWTSAVGVAFAVCAAAATRPTRLPAAALLVAVAVVVVAELAPHVLERLPSDAPRGCIASSAAEADANCP